MNDLKRVETFVADYLADLKNLLGSLDHRKIAQVAEWIRETADRGGWVFSCGNGGSSSISAQMVVDMVKCGSEHRKKRIKMLGLADSSATVTAVANDIGYENVFAEPLRNFASKGDVLVAISGSGNSPNILKAVEYAKSVGCRTVGVTTRLGGKLKDLADISLSVPSTHMGRLEDSFFAITHILCYCFVEDICPERDSSE
jgi:D-sedoheptulose 7-phosphate isomerase